MYFNTDLMEKTCHELRRKKMADIDFVEVMQLFDVGDPLCTRFGITFIDNSNHKKFRGVMDYRLMRDLDSFNVTSIEDFVYQIYLDYKMQDGPDRKFETHLKTYYNFFLNKNEGTENYFAPIKIFFKALQNLRKYKNIDLIPEEFRAERTSIKVSRCLSDPAQMARDLGQVEYIFKTKDFSHGWCPAAEFTFKESDFDQFIHEDDPETIKPLMTKADGLTLATARILGIMKEQYHHDF